MPAEAQAKPLRVFLSYSHDSAEHAERVLALADRLRRDGLDAWIDQYEAEPEDGWPRWTIAEIDRADRVLAVCTETYNRRFEGKETEGGQGVDWEGAILTDELYRRRRRFVVPVVLERADLEHLPKALRRFHHHVVDGESGYLELYRVLTGQPSTPPPIGTPRALEPRPRRSAFGLVSSTPTSPKPVDGDAVDAYAAWAAEHYGYLDLVGLDAGGVRMKLDQIYVPLRILERPEQRRDFAGKRPREEAFAGWGQTLELDRLFLRLDAEPRTRHALIFGEPGSGKTTALKKLHQLVFNARGRSGGLEALGLPPATLPVFLRLRRLTPELLENGLGAFIEAELREVTGDRLPEDLGATLWRRRRLLLLCDGLDEIADESHRAKVLERLAWQLAEPELADVRAVVSCRYGGWTAGLKDTPLGTFLRLDVRPFDDEQIARLVELWFREVARRGWLSRARCVGRGRPARCRAGRRGRRECRCCKASGARDRRAVHGAGDRRGLPSRARGALPDGREGVLGRKTGSLGPAFSFLAGPHAGHQPAVPALPGIDGS